VANFSRLLPFILGAAVPAIQAADLTINQPLISGTYQIEAFSPLGQSFEVFDASVVSIGVWLLNMNASSNFLFDRNVTLTLRTGSGFEGAVLATRTVDTAAALGSEFEAWVTFDMGPIGISPGGEYTFQLSVASPRFGVGLQQDDVFSGGRAFLTSGPPENIEFGADLDLTFRVTTQPVPELPTGWMFAGAGLALWLQRRCWPPGLKARDRIVTNDATNAEPASASAGL
jgi:hypothetical protein